MLHHTSIRPPHSVHSVMYPLDNDGYCNESINMDIGVLIREGNAGSTRWKSSAEILPF